jgi:Mg/Co/Ni transporter MgtE
MSATAREIMDIRLHTLHPQMPVSEAATHFRKARDELGEKIFGMIVIEENGKLAGMLSMYDILLLLRPKHIHVWGEMEDIEIDGYIDEACKRAGAILVGDIMTTEVVTITPDTNLLHILDIMLRKHIRRIPVVEAGRVVGMVYLSRVFFHLVHRIAP